MKTSCIVRMNIKFKPLSCNREFELGTGMTCLILFGQWGHAGSFPKTPTLRSGGFKLSYEIRQTRLSNFIFHKTGLPREIGFFVSVYLVVEVVFLDFAGDIQGMERCIQGFDRDILAFTGPILDFTTYILKFTFFTQFFYKKWREMLNYKRHWEFSLMHTGIRSKKDAFGTVPRASYLRVSYKDSIITLNENKDSGYIVRIYLGKYSQEKINYLS